MIRIRPAQQQQPLLLIIAAAVACAACVMMVVSSGSFTPVATTTFRGRGRLRLPQLSTLTPTLTTKCGGAFDAVISTTTTRSKKQKQLRQHFAKSKRNYFDDDDDVEDRLGQCWIKPSDGTADINTLMEHDFAMKEKSVDENDDDDDDDDEQVLLYDLGVDGVTLGTGALSQRIHGALSRGMSTTTTSLQTSSSTNSMEQLFAEEREQLLKRLAMECTAREAAKAALRQSGLELLQCDDMDDDDNNNENDVDDDALRHNVESIRLLDNDNDDNDNESSGDGFLGKNNSYDSWDAAAADWTPGQAFSFVVRRVPAARSEVSLDALLASLDPDGTLRREQQQAQARKNGRNSSSSSSTAMLAGMVADNARRAESAPWHVAADEKEAYSGTDAAGYRVMRACDLAATTTATTTTTTDRRATMHVMDALVSHGCLIVDVTNAGNNSDGAAVSSSSYDQAKILGDMWTTAARFFDHVATASTEEFAIPGLQTAAGAGSTHAKVGFASYAGGDLQFLETRQSRNRSSSSAAAAAAAGNDDENSVLLLPLETERVVGATGCRALLDAFDIVADLSRHVVRIVVAASTEEAGLLAGAEATEAAAKLAAELLDDGKPLLSTTGTAADDSMPSEQGSSVSMSPHRLCRYSTGNSIPAAATTTADGAAAGVDDDASNKVGGDDQPPALPQEVFGAHTDSTFITAVPVAAVSGLEVYDEAADRWYRPELAARRHWRAMRASAGDDPDALTELVTLGGNDDDTRQQQVLLPWHARYVVLMPGELLQLASRDEVLATVHRVVVGAAATTTTTTAQHQLTNTARLSAPILLRGRPGTRMDCDRYLGGVGGSPVLRECDGMTMQDIHDAMQQSQQQQSQRQLVKTNTSG